MPSDTTSRSCRAAFTLLRRSSALLLTLSVLSAPPVAAAPDGDAATTAFTTADPSIPVDQLELHLNPLTRDELVVEADAWFALLRDKVRQISDAQIAVKKKNEQMEQVEELTDAVEEARAAEEALEAQEEASIGSDSNSADEVDQTAEEADSETEADGETVATEEELAIALEDAEDVEELAEIKTAVAEIKTAVLENINELQPERSALIDRLRVVLDELDAKGGDTESYRLFMSAGSGLTIDATDSSAAWTIIVGWLSSNEGGLKWARNVASLLLVLLGFWLLSRIVGKALQRAIKHSERISDLLGDFVVQTVRRIILLIGAIEAISLFGIDIGPLMALIGATGLVVAFALQNSLSNFASGILILLYRPFDVGDGVEVAGVAGRVESMTLVSTKIRAWDNKTMLVPNNAVWDGIITNATGTKLRRVDVQIGVAAGDDVALAQKIIQRIVQDHELMLKDPEPVLQLHEVSDSAVTLICGPWARSEDYWTVYWDLVRLVRERFADSDLTLQFVRRGER